MLMILLLIGGIESNPGPTGMAAIGVKTGYLISRWSRRNQQDDWLMLSMTHSDLSSRIKALLKRIDLGTSGGATVQHQVARVCRLDSAGIVAQLKPKKANGEQYLEAEITDDVKWECIHTALGALLPADVALNAEDYLRGLKKERGEHLREFVARFVCECDKYEAAELDRGRAAQILWQKLPMAQQQVLAGLDYGTNCRLSKIQLVLANYQNWMSLDGSAAGNKNGDYMEVDQVEEVLPEHGSYIQHASRGYKPVLSGSRINFGNISGVKTMMIAWKKVVEGNESIRRESMEALQRMGGLSAASGLHGMDLTHEVGDGGNQTMLGASQKIVTFEDPTDEEDNNPDIENVANCIQEAEDFQDCYEEISSYTVTLENSVDTCSSVRERPHPNAMHIKVKIAGRVIQALVDTGASQCFVQAAWITEMKLQGKVGPCDRKVRLADGRVQKLAGVLKMMVDYGKEELLTTFYVLDGKGPTMILGYPLFHDQRWMIDLQGQRLVTQGGQEITCNTLTAKEQEVSNPWIRIPTEVKLPPHGKVEVSLPTVHIPSQKHMLIQGRGKLRAMGVYIPGGTFTDQQQVRCTLLNTTGTSVIIPADSRILRATLLSSKNFQQPQY